MLDKAKHSFDDQNGLNVNNMEMPYRLAYANFWEIPEQAWEEEIRTS